MAPGTAGMVPKISLSYSSQAGNGLLGKGWNLNGLSSLSRSGRDYYHDGQATAIEWNNNDAFYLDGSKLHVANGTYGAHNCEYKTEQETYTRVVQQWTIGNSPSWFNVTLKDGTNIRYGELRNSRVYNNAGSEVLSWKASSMHDAYGNEIQYDYETVNGEHRLRRIYYTVNAAAGIAAANEVRFLYKERSDKNKYFVSGSSYETHSLLENIEVYSYEEGLVRRYEMKYFFDGDQSLLQRITEYGADGSDLNSSVFQYKSNGDPYGLSNTQVSGVPSAPSFQNDPNLRHGPEKVYEYLLSLDFNKDGYTDLVNIDKITSSPPMPCHGGEVDSYFVSFRVNNKNNAFIQKYRFNILNICGFDRDDHISHQKVLRRENFHIGDFDGDGVDDLALVDRTNVVGSHYNSINSIRFYTNLRNLVTGGQPTVTTMPCPPRLDLLIDDYHDPDNGGYSRAYAYAGDYDGDGVSEILTAIRSANNTGVGWTELQMTSLKDNKAFEAVLPASGSTTTLAHVCYKILRSRFCSPINMNGGSAQELMLAEGNRSWILSFRKNPATGTYSSNLEGDLGYPTTFHGINIGDFNGDGLTDVLTKTRDASNLWEFGYSNGNNFGTPVAFDFSGKANAYFPYYLRPTDYTPTPDETPIVTADFNGDGKSDIAHFYTHYKSINGAIYKTANMQVHYSCGNNFREQIFEIEIDANNINNFLFYTNYYPNQYLYNNYSLYMGDFNGDGKPDMMNWLGNGMSINSLTLRGPNYLSIGAGQPNRLLTDVRNGVGIRETLFYEKLNAPWNFYTETHASQYPFIAINGPLYAVRYQGSSHKMGDYVQSTYKYKNLLALKDGRGLLGFQTIEKSTPFNSALHLALTVSSQSGHQAPFYLPTTQEVRKYVDGTNNPISTSRTTTQVIPIGSNRRFKTRTTLSEETNHLSNTTQSTTYHSYDPYDNPTLIEETIPGIESSTRAITYAPAATTWSVVPYLPEQVTTTLSKNNTQTVTTTEFTTYLKGKVQTHKVHFNTPAEITTTIAYNAITGTVASKTTSAPGETSRTTSYGYDARHRFATTETNALGQTVSSTYDPRFGTVRTAAGFDGLTTTYQYDGFGKLQNTLLPDGRTITERWYWRPAQRLTEAIMRKVVTDPAATQSYTDYNLLGNETEHGTKIWSGSGPDDWSREVLKYNYEGQLIQKTLARRHAQETALQLDYEYDHYGRLTRTCTQHGCTNITYTYTGSILKTETTDPAGRRKHTLKDAAGKLIEAKDEAGTLTYGYDGWGNVVQTKAGGQSFTVAAYDAYNRKQSMTETSSGLTRYEYTGYGELKKQTDAAGKITQMQYDALGRPTLVTTPEGTVTTEYYNAPGTGNGRQLKAITRKDNQGHTEHSKTYTYDNLGRLVNTTYHNGRYTTWTYDALSRVATQRYVSGATVRFSYQDGHIKQVSGSGGLYTLKNVNGLGMPLQELRGNGKETFLTYDYGNLVSTTTQGVQEYFLEHDFTRGLITRRTDGLAQRMDAFSYDDAGRLEKTSTSSLSSLPGPLPPDQVQTYGSSSLGAANIVHKTDIGAYSYGGHRLGYIDNGAGAIPVVRQEVSYSSYHRPLSITEGPHRVAFVYDGEGARSVMERSTNGVLDYRKEYYDDGSVLYYSGAGLLAERVTPVSSGSGIAYVVVTRPGGGSGGPGDPPPPPFEPEGMSGASLEAEEAGAGLAEGLVVDDYSNEPCCPVTQVYYAYVDHLGSVVALTDGRGTVVHRQAFDAWGRRRNVQTWVTDDSQVPAAQYRWLWGYTGHEMLDEFGLINMNARLYDPRLGRMLSVDNYVSDATSVVAYNRYSYANCNPISYVDPSGNFVWFVPLIYAAVNVAVDLAINNGKMDFGQIATSAVTGAIGGFTSGATTAGMAFAGAAVSQVGRLMPSIPVYQSREFNIGISPMVGFGTSGFNLGASVNVSGQVGNLYYSASFGVGFNSGMSSLGDAAGGSSYWNGGGFIGYEANSTLYGLGYSYNKFFGGQTNQGVGAIHMQIGDFGLRFDEDFIGDGKDRYRTGGLQMTYRINKDLTIAVGASMMTGWHQGDALRGGNPNAKDGRGLYDNCKEDLFNLRGGALYGGVIYKGQSYFYGNNSEKRLHTVQNAIHKNWPIRTSPYFEDRGFSSRSFSYYGSYHPYYLNY